MTGYKVDVSLARLYHSEKLTERASRGSNGASQSVTSQRIADASPLTTSQESSKALTRDKVSLLKCQRQSNFSISTIPLSSSPHSLVSTRTRLISYLRSKTFLVLTCVLTVFLCFGEQYRGAFKVWTDNLVNQELGIIPQLPSDPGLSTLMSAGQTPRRYQIGGMLHDVGKGFFREELSKQDLEMKHAEDKEYYESEIRHWKNYAWTAPPVDESLTKLEADLTKGERTLRQWIEKLHQGAPATPVGLQAKRTNPGFSTAWPRLQKKARLEDMPTLGKGVGSEVKWAALQRHLTSPGDERMCSRQNWIHEYQQMHKEMLSGERPGKFISYHCERDTACGGISDRILGMTSAFFMGLIQGRAYLAEWQSPVPLEVIFDSPMIDWSYSKFDPETHLALRDPELRKQARDLDILQFSRPEIDTVFKTTEWTSTPKQLSPGMEQRDEAFQSPWINMYANRGMIIRGFEYSHLSTRLNELGLQSHTAFACILRYLFKPKQSAQNLIARYTSILALPSVFSIGIQIRTGDISMKSEKADRENTVEKHEDFFRCARELGQTHASPGQRIVYYLVTDSEHLKIDAQSVLGDQLLLTDMKPQHVHVASSKSAAEGVFSALTEMWILAKTDMKVQTKGSGFGKLATFMTGVEHKAVSITPVHKRTRADPSAYFVDCTRFEALLPFRELANTWSLG